MIFFRRTTAKVGGILNSPTGFYWRLLTPFGNFNFDKDGWQSSKLSTWERSFRAMVKELMWYKWKLRYLLLSLTAYFHVFTNFDPQNVWCNPEYTHGNYKETKCVRMLDLLQTAAATLQSGIPADWMVTEILHFFCLFHLGLTNQWNQ